MWRLCCSNPTSIVSRRRQYPPGVGTCTGDRLRLGFQNWQLASGMTVIIIIIMFFEGGSSPGAFHFFLKEERCMLNHVLYTCLKENYLQPAQTKLHCKKTREKNNKPSKGMRFGWVCRCLNISSQGVCTPRGMWLVSRSSIKVNSQHSFFRLGLKNFKHTLLDHLESEAAPFELGIAIKMDH